MSETLIEVKNLSKHYKISRKLVLKAVDDVSFEIRRGETFGLVGESGCGKTTCGRTLINLYSPTSGQVIYDGQDISHMPKSKILDFKRRIQMIFQDPYSSLNPRMTISELIAQGLNIHFKMTKKEQEAKVNALMADVGLTEAFGNRFAHELSGGQRQRVGIARALAVAPEFIVCDEPISALDVSIQAQIINLLIKLQRERKLTYLFISHDLSMVKHISDRVGVMYLGNMVEIAPSMSLFDEPLHPYTQMLLSAIPEAEPDPSRRKRAVKIEGEVPSPITPPPGCKFSSRCAYAKDQCKLEVPTLRELKPDHFVACHFPRNYEEASSC